MNCEQEEKEKGHGNCNVFCRQREGAEKVEVENNSKTKNLALGM